jgi:hypothetical protein
VTRTRLISSIITIVATVILAPSCSSDDGRDLAGTSTSTTASSVAPADGAALDGDLPPKDTLAFAHLYEEQLTELGVRLTARGGLIDTSDGGYVQSEGGMHLALYVEPIAQTFTPDQYIDGIQSVAKVFADDVFDRWPGLVSFDVCQEPPQTLDPRPEPVATTQIELTREQNDAIDWDTVTVEDLVAASLAEPRGVKLVVSALINANPRYQAMVAEAQGA